MQSKEVSTFHNIMQFKKENAVYGLIDIDHLYLDFSNENQNACFIQNYAKQILNNHIWFTGVEFKLRGDQKVRDFVLDHYPQIAHAIQQLDPLAVKPDDQTEENAIQYSSWLKINDFIAVRLSRVMTENVQDPFIK